MYLSSECTFRHIPALLMEKSIMQCCKLFSLHFINSHRKRILCMISLFPTRLHHIIQAGFPEAEMQFLFYALKREEKHGVKNARKRKAARSPLSAENSSFSRSWESSPRLRARLIGHVARESDWELHRSTCSFALCQSAKICAEGKKRLKSDAEKYSPGSEIRGDFRLSDSF